MSSFWEAKDYNPQMLQGINQGVGAVQEGMAFAREQDRRAKPLHESFQALFDSPQLQSQIDATENDPQARAALVQQVLGQLRGMAGGTGGMQSPQINAMPQIAGNVGGSMPSAMPQMPAGEGGGLPPKTVDVPVPAQHFAPGQSAAGQTSPFGGFMPHIPQAAPRPQQPLAARRPMTVGDLEDGKAALPLMQQRLANEERHRAQDASLGQKREKDAALLALKERGLDDKMLIELSKLDNQTLQTLLRIGSAEKIADNHNETAVDVANINQTGATTRTGMQQAGAGERLDKKLDADSKNLKARLDATATNVEKRLAAKGSGGGGGGGSANWTPEGKAIVQTARAELMQAEKELGELRTKQLMPDQSKEVQSAVQRAEAALRKHDEAVRRANQLKAGQASPAGIQPGQSVNVGGRNITRVK